jgi:1,2-phenylacetyl-CoA epoxidase catalytic subunit
LSTAGEIASPERQALGHLILSLANNKAALGRRYGEWAVSAPTLESSVAAAAMAQDELGHARATYPLLKQLGLEVRDDEERLEIGPCMPVLGVELPGWEWFVAVNLAVDGMLTTFVRACQESAFVGLAQRARKILQEEGAHRVHAEAWLKRICGAGGGDRELLLRRIDEMWEQAARWPGPDDHRGYGEAVGAAMVSEGPAAIRGRVRDWLASLLASEQCAGTVALAEPVDWSSWREERRW